jgi:hypothetical protein
MPLDAKPLFRPDVLRPHLAGFNLPEPVESLQAPLRKWAEMLSSAQADKLNEKELLPDFLTDVFCGVLGYRRIVDSPERFTFSREKHVKVDGKFADAVLGDFDKKHERFVVAVEGKGPKDPLDRPHGSRKMSAVDQGYRYAINLPCDWIIVTSMRETRLYHKGSNQHTYERFDIRDLATDESALKRFVFLLGADRVVPAGGKCHFEELLAASEHIGRELTKEFYLRYAEMREQAFDHLRKDNATVPAADLLRATQKLLDRVLFCCFAEDRGLLPAQTVEHAYKHNDPYNPRPIYENFRGLFRAVNVGNGALHIPAYNGGLFADDPVLDGLKVSDDVCRHFQDLSAYDFRPASQAANKDERFGGPSVDVDILGHIFEQSISDLERLHDELSGRAEAVSTQDRVSRRKKEGAFYTQAFITRYIVGQALGGVLRDRFETLRRRHADEAAGTVGKVMEDPIAYDTATLNRPQKAALLRFWADWQDELGKVRVVDPACGSGAFLLEAFDQLYDAYQLANDRLVLLRGQRSLFDLDRHILQHNLYGVDLNHEAVEICRLSLWIKTAEQGKALTSLDGTIMAGNSVVSDSTLDPRAFDWEKTFPQVFAEGGFDVVVANPPYVRQEWLTPIKPYLKQHYKAYDGVADLYVYFYELGLRLLKPEGRMSFIVTNKWLRSGYGGPLRKLLGAESWVESVVDFGHAKQIFPDADVFPCIMTARKPSHGPAPAAARVCVIPREILRIEDLTRQIEDEGFEIPRDRLGENAWNLEPPGVSKLIEKITRTGVPLKEFAGVGPLYGIKTGCNEAFLVDTPTRDRLIAEDPSSSSIIQKYIRGQDTDRWASEWSGLWMIFARKGIDIDTYPAVKNHLLKYRTQLEPRPRDFSGQEWPGRKPGAYKWYELQDPVDYWQAFQKPKIVYQDITWKPQFSLDVQGMLANNTAYILPAADLWLLAVLNSPVGWWFAWRKAQHAKDEALRFFGDFVEAFPVPKPSTSQRETAERAVRRLTELAGQRHKGTGDILDWLRVEFEVSKPSQKLQALLDLDQDGLVAEVRKMRGKSKPLNPTLLRTLKDGFAEYVEPLRKLLPEANALEAKLSDCVNEAFGLTTEEVALMWETAPPRMPITRM